MRYLKHPLIFCLICTTITSPTTSLQQNGSALEDICSLIPLPKVMQVDVVCTEQLPDFSKINFPHAQHVYELSVYGCGFELVSKNSFRGLTGMHHLFITCKESDTITQLQLEEGLFDDLPNLSQVVIHGGRIRSLPSGLFCKLPGLTQLFIADNDISFSSMLGFGTNCSSRCGSNVEVLQLLKNSIMHLPNRTFCTLTNLTYLDVSENGLETVEEDAFYNLGSLTLLDLSHNNLTTMPEKTLKPLINLHSLDLANNPNLNISGFLKSVPRLRELYLPGIGLEFLDKDSFQGLRNVISLMLYDNRLQTVHEDVFEPFIGLVHNAGNETATQECAEDALQRLVFGGEYSSFVEMKRRSFNGTGLQYLSLDGNNLTAMPPVRKLFTLLILSISRNQIEILDDDSFATLPQLQRLTLSFNRIQFINQRIFSNLRCLKHLLLNHNTISYINSTAFHDLTALSLLHLQHNRIKDIRGLFINNENLNALNLSYNHLEVLSLEMMPLNISVLDVSHNFIKHLLYPPGSLSKHIHMTLLDLSHNQIGAINQNFFPISLVNLSLHDNLIENIDNCVFCSLNVIANITMHYNRLQNIHPEDLRQITVPKFREFPVVSLEGNRFICNCELEEMSYMYSQNDERYLRIYDFENLFCDREYFKNKPTRIRIVQALAPEDFLCKMSRQGNDSMSEACVVYHDLNWKYIIGDCSGNNLTLIPTEVYPGVRKLFLDGNSFATLKNTVFRARVHQNLTELYLNGSHIEVIEDNTFIELVKLSHLYLQNNKLKNLTKDTFAGLSQLIELRLSSNNIMMMDNNVFHPLSELRHLMLNNNQLRTFPFWEWHSDVLSSISLSKNPWSCECDYVENYREWLQDWASAVIDLETLYCKFDNDSASGAPLIAFNASHCIQPTEFSFLKSKHFPLLTGLITTLVLFTITGIFLYLYRKEMQVLIYSRFGVRIFHRNDAQRFDGEKTFDAFICYSNSDEDFVIDQLLPSLEGIEPPFRCCIHQRDFLIGGFITDNILEGVSKSRRTILVLTEAFISSEWCRFEFKTAYVQMLKDKCNRVIVVVVGEIPKQLDPEMKLYLKTNTYISWGDKLFWERLYFAMPDRTKKVTNDIQLS